MSSESQSFVSVLLSEDDGMFASFDNGSNPVRERTDGSTNAAPGQCMEEAIVRVNRSAHVL